MYNSFSNAKAMGVIVEMCVKRLGCRNLIYATDIVS